MMLGACLCNKRQNQLFIDSHMLENYLTSSPIKVGYILSWGKQRNKLWMEIKPRHPVLVAISSHDQVTSRQPPHTPCSIIWGSHYHRFFWMQYYTADFATHESELFPQSTAKNLLEASQHSELLLLWSRKNPSWNWEQNSVLHYSTLIWSEWIFEVQKLA